MHLHRALRRTATVTLVAALLPTGSHAASADPVAPRPTTAASGVEEPPIPLEASISGPTEMWGTDEAAYTVTVSDPDANVTIAWSGGRVDVTTTDRPDRVMVSLPDGVGDSEPFTTTLQATVTATDGRTAVATFPFVVKPGTRIRSLDPDSPQFTPDSPWHLDAALSTALPFTGLWDVRWGTNRPECTVTPEVHDQRWHYYPASLTCSRLPEGTPITVTFATTSPAGQDITAAHTVAYTYAAVTPSIHVTDGAVYPGRTATVTGALTLDGARPFPVERLTLDQSTDGGKTWATIATAGPGVARITATPRLTRAAQFRLTAADTVAHRTWSATSDTVPVNRYPTRLALTRAAGPAPTLTGTLINGGTETALAGATVRVQARRAGTSAWATMATLTTDRAGRVTYRPRPGPATAYRLHHPGTATTEASTSPTVSVAAPAPDRLTLTVTPAARSRITATFRTGATGRPVAGRPVTLQVRWVGTHRWITVRTLRTDPRGRVAYRTYSTRAGHWRATAGPVRSTPVLNKVATTIAVRPLARAGGVHARLTTSLGAPLARRTLTLQTRPDGTKAWRTLATVTTGRDGRAHADLPTRTGTRYRWVFTGTDRHAGSTSAATRR